ncbi:alpha/beta hydrolase [Curtobacterium ammoniigenes]|uniref:alpha/beta hydrolase n=1 Tax=Curtobacterium ammoniigenes TaxID=395387 RepID=UPI00082C9AEA|nr:alpha/beta fold hydrolase [Curtobacterium ammoniigenes]
MSLRSAARAAGIAIGAGAVAGGAAAGVLVAAMSRIVVTPDRRRVERVPLVAVDLARGTLTLARTADTELPGRYSVWFRAGSGHARVGDVISATPDTVTREILALQGASLSGVRFVRWGGWFYLHPGELDVPVEDVAIPTPNGAAPAWVVRADDPAAPWAVLVHGRGVTRAETIRAVPVFRAAGYSVLLASWRNDGVAPASRDGRYRLGDTEWEDIDACLTWITEAGGRSVVLMGWSMGGAVVLQTLLRSSARRMIQGVVLESPVVDWATVLRSQAAQLRLPPFVLPGVQWLLRTRLMHRVAGAAEPVDIRSLDMVARSAELDVPILILHSDDDGFVPSTASHALAGARPDLVRLEIAHTARHTKLWNHDADWFDARILAWLTEVLRVVPATESR